MKKHGSFFQRISNDHSFQLPEIIACDRVGQSEKVLLQFDDGARVEMVLLFMKNHITLCLSSQVGCRQGCNFCQTAQMGLKRNLSGGEILSQIFVARFLLGYSPQNIVFMGMGEPFDNIKEVIKAIEVISDQRGPWIPKRRIGLSTCGHLPGIRELTRIIRTSDPNLAWHRLNLTVSLNSAIDEKRALLMPINKGWPLEKLRHAITDYLHVGKGPVILGYVVIPGFNDSEVDIEALIDFIGDLRCQINLIPYAPPKIVTLTPPRGLESFTHCPSSEEHLDPIFHRLLKKGFRVYKRDSKGREQASGCGQLGIDIMQNARCKPSENIQN